MLSYANNHKQQTYQNCLCVIDIARSKHFGMQLDNHQKREKKKTEHTNIAHTARNSERKIFTSCCLMQKKRKNKIQQQKNRDYL